MNPPVGPDLNIIEVVWDNLTRERNKRHLQFWIVFQRVGELFLGRLGMFVDQTDQIGLRKNK